MTDSDREIVMKWLLSHNFWALTGMQYAVFPIFSIFAFQYFAGRISKERAAALQRAQLQNQRCGGNRGCSARTESSEGNLGNCEFFYSAISYCNYKMI